MTKFPFVEKVVFNVKTSVKINNRRMYRQTNIYRNEMPILHETYS